MFYQKHVADQLGAVWDNLGLYININPNKLSHLGGEEFIFQLLSVVNLSFTTKIFTTT